MYQKENKQHHLPKNQERKTIRSYILCNFWLYLILSLLHSTLFIYLFYLGNTFKSFYSAFFSICFLIAAVMVKRLASKVNLQKDYSSRFKKTVEGLMSLDWIIIFINFIGFFYVLVFVVLMNKNTEEAATEYGWWPLIDGTAHILAITPFICQISKHEDVQDCLAQIRSTRIHPVDRVRFSGKKVTERRPLYGFAESL